MDISKEYIKMCDYENIQVKRKEGLWEEGDFYVAYKRDRVFCWGGEGEDEPYDNSNPVWLPRQDQLQEMWEYSHSSYSKIQKFTAELDNDFDYFVNFDSMEQLWFAFVMHELYQKKWDGDKWI